MAQHITTTPNNGQTVVSRLVQTDGTTSNGTVTTRVQPVTSASGTVYRMTTTDSGAAPDDTATCAELAEFALDMQKHWEAVGAAVALVAAAAAEASGSGSGSGSGA